MAWNAPVTWVANAVLTAAQLNAQLRDNISETAPAKATTAGSHFVTVGANSIAERRIVTASVATSQGTSSTTYVDLTTPGPSVTLTTGTNALIWINARINSGNASNQALASFNVSGASAISAGDARAMVCVSSPITQRYGICVQIATLTPGTNTFKMLYRTGNTDNTATFSDRTIVVMGL